MHKVNKIIDKIKSALINNKIILSNFTYLGILQFVRVIIPLLVLPYLIRVLGLELYGMVIFAQTIVFFFLMVINFGFELSATKQISINRSNLEKVSEIVSSVITIKIILLIIISIIYCLLIIFIPKLNNYFLLFVFSFLFCFQEIFIPIWFFQGIEKMKYITIIDVISRIIYLSLTFIFINNSNDYLLVPIFRFIGIAFAGIISSYIIFVKGKIRFIFVTKNKLYYYFRDSLPFFYSKFSSVINDRTNILLLGFTISMTSVAYYDFVYKIVGAINSLFGLLVRAFYPHIARTKNLLKIKKIFYFNVTLSTLSYLILCLFSKKIILIIVGNDMLPAQPLFYSLGLVIPLVAIGWSLGDLNLATFGFNKIYSLSSIYSTALYLTILGGLYLLNVINLYSLVFALLFRLVFLDIYRYYYCKKLNLL